MTGAERTMHAHKKKNLHSERKNNTRKNQKYYMQYDYILLFMTVAIALFGVMMIQSASFYTANSARFSNPYRFVARQLLGLGIGVLAMIIVSNVSYRIFMRKIPFLHIPLIYMAYLLAIILQGMVLIPGIGIYRNGARRWISLGGIMEFQPAEITKIAVIMLVSYMVYISGKEMDQWKGILKIILVCSPAYLLIIVQNMSTAIIVCGISFFMCVVASRDIKIFFATALTGVMGLAIYLLFLGGFRMGRIHAWLDIENDPGGFQILQGLYAISSGGIFGAGLGKSVQKLGYIPEAYNDMIFSVICEELGIVGAVFLLVAFMILLWRIVIIACKAPDVFSFMICAGVMFHIAIQVLLNVAVVSNAIPSTGISLPLISYGGTSVMIMMAELGLVLGVSKREMEK